MPIFIVTVAVIASLAGILPVPFPIVILVGLAYLANN